LSNAGGSSTPGKLDQTLTDEWPVWRLVIENVATLEEIDRSWCLDDIAKMNALLDHKKFSEALHAYETKQSGAV